MRVVIHQSPAVPWQSVRGAYFAEGFRALGIPYRFSTSRARENTAEIPVLLGTTFWKNLETDGGRFLLVDRCSFGDTDRFVSLVWNGHGRRGDHKVPKELTAARWAKYRAPLRPWHRNGKRRVLCGQTEVYSPKYQSLQEWYGQVSCFATHFRQHPAGLNPTALPPAYDFRNTALAITLNSSIGVQAVLDGVPTVTMDEGAMAWEVASHHPREESVTPIREQWCWWLAWTQWADEEIRDGSALKHLFAEE